jgi:hypothetical protein
VLRSGPTEQHSAAADCPCRKDRARGRPLPEVAWSFENPDGSKQKSADQAWAAARLHWQREACARSAVGRPASAAYLLGAPQVGRRWQRGHCRSRRSLVAVIAAARTDPTNDGGGSSPGFRNRRAASRPLACPLNTRCRAAWARTFGRTKFTDLTTCRDARRT